MRIGNTALVLLGCAVLAGCGSSDPPASSGATQPFADAVITDPGKQRWARTCAMCHVRGEGGAPKIGDTADWSKRLEQGEAVVLEHAIVGLGNMPPLGYCMDCEREDLRAYIRFMVSGGGA